ncbi:MAG: glycosyltransferase family 2 protein [Cyanobacteriota bacterium]|jgi:glycosyltransferase involved in cell wall biosynthesis
MNESNQKTFSGVVSVVIPVYNEETVLPVMIERLEALREKCRSFKLEFLFIDDGSVDKTREILERAYYEKGFYLISFSRNFGHQAAVSAGLRHAKGDFIAIIDGDLQDPPEAIPEMVNLLMKTGADVAYGVRRRRKESAFKRFSYYLFYRLLRRLTPISIPLDSGDFSVISRRVASVINEMPEKHRFVRGLRSYAGFEQVPFYYSRDSRAAGEPKYTFSKLIALAADGIFTFSEIPLKFSTFLGLTISISSFLFGFLLILWRLSSGAVLPGFATLSVGLFFLGGVQLLCLGILGEYIGRIHSEVKKRPSFVIDKFLGPSD